MYAEQKGTSRQAISNTYRMQELSLDTLMLKGNVGAILSEMACDIHSTKIRMEEGMTARKGRRRKT